MWKLPGCFLFCVGPGGSSAMVQGEHCINRTLKSQDIVLTANSNW